MAQFPDEHNDDGSFVRQDDACRETVTDSGDSRFPAASGRYHLYISLACPWAHRTLIVRHLLGLNAVVGVTVVDPVRDERGWAFREGPGTTADPVNGFRFLAEAYTATDPAFSGRVTVPVLWDKERGVIVNNSEDDICWMLAHGFQRFQSREADLFPHVHREEQHDLSAYIYENINNGVYEAGFATKQSTYEAAVQKLFAALETLDLRLANRRYLLGPRFVESDWRLFCTLIRFDAVYHGHFKCNVRQIRDFKHLSRFLRDLYHEPGIAETVNFDHIKRHYYMTHGDINPTGIVPVGPDLSWLQEPVVHEPHS
jgi:putative glutathione S-transferase